MNINDLVAAVKHDDFTEQLVMKLADNLKELREQSKAGTINTFEYARSRNEMLHQWQEAMGRVPASVMVTPTQGNFGTGVKPNLTTPPQPRNVNVVGTFSSILVSWAQPDYSNHAYAEILRADVNDIGQAIVIGSSVGRQYADAVGEAADKYYWVRFVSIQNVKGPASTGQRGKTALSAEFVMANLLAQTWQEAMGLVRYDGGEMREPAAR